MNKKLLGALGALLLLGSTAVFSNTGIGAQAGYSISDKIGGMNTSVTFKFGGFPMVFAADLTIQRNFLTTGLTADYWVVNPEVFAILHWYTGPGLAASVVLTDYDFNSVYLAGRWVLGLNMFIYGPWELYIQSAAEIGLTLNDEIDFPKWRVPLNVGFRYWF